MAIGGYDGTIKIDSSVNSKNFNKGVKGMTAQVAKLGVAIAAAFAVKAVVQFGKVAVDEASKMASALIGLQSIVDGTGNSFTDAQAFISDFTEDGLVPAGNAITAYKNLLSRGYDTSQIEATLIRLKDSAAFGRQASLTLGDAVQSATEGLKNENSILVDNAGVTRNVSLMWADYADSIGTTVSALTKEQKIQAEVNGIMTETRFQIGDAAKLSGTYAGQISSLGVSFLNLKVAVGNTIIPILAKIIPYIKAAIDALTIFFNRLARIVNLLFGTNIGVASQETAGGMGDIAESAGDAAGGMGDLAEETDAAGKAAKGALAGFDDLNVLQKETSTGAASSAAGGADIGGSGGGLDSGGILDEAAADMDELTGKVDAWKAKFLAFTQPVTDALGGLYEKAKPLGKTLWEGLKWAWDNILVPLGAWAITGGLPAFLDSLGAVLSLLDVVLKKLEPSFTWFWENVLQPLANWTGGAIVEAWDSITWSIESLTEMLENNDATFWVLIATIGIFVAILLVAGAPIWLIVAAIIGVIMAIKNWDAIIQWFSKQWETFTNFLSSSLEKAIAGMPDWVKNIFNGIIGYVNGMISAIVYGINAVIGALNSIQVTLPSWIPEFGGSSFGVNLGYVNAPQIPYLASGAVIPPNAEFAAILGDQKSGTNIETPENLLRQIMREEMGGTETEIKVSFEGTLGALVRELKPIIDKETKRMGGSLLAGGTI